MNGSFCAIYDSLLVLDCCNKPIFISIHTVNPPCSSYQYSIQMQISQSKESTLALLDLVLLETERYFKPTRNDLLDSDSHLTINNDYDHQDSIFKTYCLHLENVRILLLRLFSMNP